MTAGICWTMPRSKIRWRPESLPQFFKSWHWKTIASFSFMVMIMQHDRSKWASQISHRLKHCGSSAVATVEQLPGRPVVNHMCVTPCSYRLRAASVVRLPQKQKSWTPGNYIKWWVFTYSLYHLPNSSPSFWGLLWTDEAQANISSWGLNPYVFF